MPDLALLAQLDRLLAEQGCKLAPASIGYRLQLPAGADRDQIVAELVRLVLGSPVTVSEARDATTHVTKCRDCSAEIMLVANAKKPGKWLAVDRRPLQVVTDQGVVVRGREHHMATCPYRDRALARQAQERHRREAEGEE